MCQSITERLVDESPLMKATSDFGERRYVIYDARKEVFFSRQYLTAVSSMRAG
jgi:hypothetical protein